MEINSNLFLMENTCECLLGDSGCESCDLLQEEYRLYCWEGYQSYLQYIEENPDYETCP